MAKPYYLFTQDDATAFYGNNSGDNTYSLLQLPIRRSGIGDASGYTCASIYRGNQLSGSGNSIGSKHQ